MALAPTTPPLVFAFPGQSSVRADAVARARQSHPAAAEVARQAADALTRADLQRWLSADQAPLDSNRDVQVVVFLATQMYLAALRAEGLEAQASLGLSLGEYSHVVHIGALDFAEALRLVSERGTRFDEAPPGMMVTVLGVGHDEVADAVGHARALGEVGISNYNGPTQHVISGEARAVTHAAAQLEDEWGAHTVVIEDRVPMHSPLMAGPASAFAPALADAPWKRPHYLYHPNVTGEPVDAAGPDAFVHHLTRHVSEPVLWQASVDHAAAHHADATFVEVGPGGVLHTMFGRWWKTLRRAHVDAPDGVEPREHFARTVEALHA